jgi:hypothetical protein
MESNVLNSLDELWNNSSKIEMFSSTAEWLDDWVENNGPEQLNDSFDMNNWMEEEMIDAIDLYISCSYKKSQTKKDCKDVLRTFLFEYFQFRKSIMLHKKSNSVDECEKETIVKRILSRPQTEQKTKEWKNEALNLLTGHEFADVVYGSESMRNNVIAKKCIGLTHESSEQICFVTPVDGKLSPFKWGWRYEPVVKMIFELYGAKGEINDKLGRIRHSTLPRLAASPDGLIVSGPKTGNLVEIKSPISRTLDYSVPTSYWCQMQLQAEVCDVDVVEYVEIKFEAAPLNKETETFLKKPFKNGVPNMFGLVIVVGKEEDYNSNRYIYSPVFEKIDEFMKYKPKYKKGEKILEISVYRVEDYFHESVLRNKVWWESVGKPAYEDFWIDVDEAKKSGKFNVEEKATFFDD